MPYRKRLPIKGQAKPVSLRAPIRTGHTSTINNVEDLHRKYLSWDKEGIEGEIHHLRVRSASGRGVWYEPSVYNELMLNAIVFRLRKGERLRRFRSRELNRIGAWIEGV